MSEFVIAADIGNSSIRVGVGPLTGMGWQRQFRFDPDPGLSADDWRQIVVPHLPIEVSTRIASIVCSSVVPAITAPFLAALTGITGIESQIITHRSANLSIRVATDFPEKTGTDRIVNANTAWVTWGGPVVVVDTGTATKIDAITNDGRFLGGVIATGIRVSMDALAGSAAQLSAVPFAMPTTAIGTNTLTAMQSGVVLGHARMIDGMIAEVVAELGEPVAVVLTGGYSDLLYPRISRVTTIEPDLILDGLRLIAG